MEQSPSWEADSRSASQEIPSVLCNPDVHYRVQKGPWLGYVLNQMKPHRTGTSYFFEINFDIILHIHA
jgi:hypothetical protein